MSILRAAGALLLLLGAAACAAIPPLTPTPAPPPDRLQPHTTQQGDRITADFRTDDFKIWIESEKGIGKANFERPGAPPESVTIHLRLKGLEEFSLAWGDATVTGHYSSTGAIVREELSRAGGASAPNDPTSPYYMPVRIHADNPTLPLQDGDFVLTAPPAFIGDAPERFTLQWIDFYR